LFESTLEFDRWADPEQTLPDSLADMLLAVGKRAAIRQASRLEERRGVQPSQTSKDDAAADAVLRVLQHMRRLDKSNPAQWQTVRFRRAVNLYAARGAFNSLASWSSLGMTGGSSLPRRPIRGSQRLAQPPAEPRCPLRPNFSLKASLAVSACCNSPILTS
jgi:hypothetical protein